MQDCKTRISTYTLCKRRSSRLWQAGFRTFAEREARHGLPQKVDPDSLLPEDVYEDLVPVLRNDVRDQWKHRIQAGIGSKRIFIFIRRIKMNKGTHQEWRHLWLKLGPTGLHPMESLKFSTGEFELRMVRFLWFPADFPSCEIDHAWKFIWWFLSRFHLILWIYGWSFLWTNQPIFR